jgi:flagellar basal-body rod protein FlgB
VAINMQTVDALEHAMTFNRERHTVLAGNVANLDTPGYRPVDLMRGNPDGSPGTLAATTSGTNIGATGSEQIVQSFDDGGQLQGPDGNAVSLERELSKIDANRTRYATAAELVGRRLALLRYAAGDGT